nr:SH3 domain-containing protein [Nonlabens ulvanivorans]
MRILLTVLLLLNYAFAKAETTPSYDKECIYVVAKSGLNMRDVAGPDGNVIMKLPYGTKLDWSPPGSRDVKTFVIDNGKKLEGYWVKVWKSVPYEDLKDNPGGYVFSAYLSYHLDDLPLLSLYLFNDFSYIDCNYESLYSATYQVNEDTYNYSAYIDCYPRYQEHVEPLTVINRMKSEYGDDATAFLKSKIKIEAVELEDVIHKKKISPYDIDESNKPDYIYNDGNENDGGWFKFNLPLKNGTVKTIEPWQGEFSYNHHYLGKIEALNLYVLYADFEGREYYGIDMETGEKKQIHLNIAPKSHYSVEFGHFYMVSGAQLEVKYLDKNLVLQNALSINFQSWEIDEELSSSFWISKNELILKVHPIDSAVTGTYYDDRKEEHSWQYLKLTIL